MKRKSMVFTILLAAFVLLMSNPFAPGSALAGEEASEADEQKDFSNIELQEKSIESIDPSYLRKDRKEKNIFDLGSKDTLTISEDGYYTVDTGDVVITLLPPFGWNCFTQDLKTQLEAFVDVFTDPVAVVNSLIEEEIHYFIFDYDYRLFVEVKVSKDTLGSIIKDSNLLTDEEEEIVIDLLETSYTDVSIVPEDLGGRRFYIMNNEDLSLIVAETYVMAFVSTYLTILWNLILYLNQISMN